MRTLYDVQQLLKKFGIIVYIGERLADLELMELELRQLYQARVLENREYETALLIIRQEKRLEKEKKIEGERNG
ncbi:YqgQ family protein [Heyndrickxia coagulans]|uniref:YqgQ family protein n=1 Tax=Heyndrickxia coagulans TaxID=1398 RepID=UPI0023E3A8BD|nr:YqgQ family protein [Heyndrickxia coagulans]